MDHFLRFYTLGLHGNPFRTLSDDEWAAVAVLPPELAAWQDGVATRLQVLGDRGLGKSTLLRGLHARCIAQGLRSAYEYLPPEQTQFTTDTRNLQVFLLDEAQRLTAHEQIRLAALPTERLIISSHADLTSVFARHGQALQTLALAPVDIAGLGRMIERRLQFFALASGPRISFSPSALARLQAYSQGNPRAAERLLYDLLQRREQPGEIGAEDILR